MIGVMIAVGDTTKTGAKNQTVILTTGVPIVVDGDMVSLIVERDCGKVEVEMIDQGAVVVPIYQYRFTIVITVTVTITVIMRINPI